MDHILNEFFVSPARIVNKDFRELHSLPVVRSDVTVEHLYRRDATRTVVNILSKGSVRIVCKIFKVDMARSLDTPPDLLEYEEHEIEMRYLVILSDMVRSGKFDACIMPLGYICVHSDALVESRLVATNQKDMFYSGKGNGNYAVILAEAADTSLSDVVRLRAVDGDEVLGELVIGFCFQICFMLACVHACYPSFRHNDAHTSNILVQVHDVNEMKNVAAQEGFKGDKLEVEYRFSEGRWRLDIEKHPYRCLLWDMAFASIQAKDTMKAGTPAVTPRKTGFGRSRRLEKTNTNQSLDMFKIIDTMRTLLEKKGARISRRGTDVMEELAPKKYSVTDVNLTTHEKDRRMHDLVIGGHQLPTPTQILNNSNVFDGLKYIGDGRKAFSLLIGNTVGTRTDINTNWV